MKRIQFDIRYRADIEIGKCSVVNGQEQPVTILNWENGSGAYPILAQHYGQVVPFVHAVDGTQTGDDRYNLYILVEDGLTDFEYAIGEKLFDPPFSEAQIELIKVEAKEVLEKAREELTDRTANKFETSLANTLEGWDFKTDYSMVWEYAKLCGPVLLEEARKEFQRQLDNQANQHVASGYKDGYRDGVAQGRLDTLKEIPHWKKATRYADHMDQGLVLTKENELRFAYEVDEGEYFIDPKILLNLPKDEGEEETA